MSTKFLASAYKDYSETEYVLTAQCLFNTEKEAKDFLKDQCQDLQHVQEIECGKML